MRADRAAAVQTEFYLNIVLRTKRIPHPQLYRGTTYRALIDPEDLEEAANEVWRQLEEETPNYHLWDLPLFLADTTFGEMGMPLLLRISAGPAKDAASYLRHLHGTSSDKR